jgi:hypothetical protein
MPKRAKQIGKTQTQTLKGWQQISDFLGDPEQSSREVDFSSAESCILTRQSLSMRIALSSIAKSTASVGARDPGLVVSQHRKEPSS